MKTPIIGARHLAVAAGALLGITAARADDALNNDLRLGSYTIFYHTRADDITGPYVPAGVNLKAENLETLYAAYVRRISPELDVELAMGWPPLAKIRGQGPAYLGSVPYNGVTISGARWIAPTLLLEYKFLDETALLRPYIGVGVNYTTFYDRDPTAQGNAGSGGPTKVSLTASVGPAATAGLTYRISDRFHLHASYSFSQVKTHLSADTDGVIRTSYISFGPQALVVSAGFSF
jgi:outer membrane protein